MCCGSRSGSTRIQNVWRPDRQLLFRPGSSSQRWIDSQKLGCEWKKLVSTYFSKNYWKICQSYKYFIILDPQHWLQGRKCNLSSPVFFIIITKKSALPVGKHTVHWKPFKEQSMIQRNWLLYLGRPWMFCALKGKKREIFNLRFYHQKYPPWTLIHILNLSQMHISPHPRCILQRGDVTPCCILNWGVKSYRYIMHRGVKSYRCKMKRGVKGKTPGNISPLHNAAVRFHMPLYDAVGSQILPL